MFGASGAPRPRDIPDPATESGKNIWYRHGVEPARAQAAPPPAPSKEDMMSKSTGVATRPVALDPSMADGLRVFKALAHETRLRILGLLDQRERTVTELTAEFDLAQPSISRHLGILNKADLVHRRRAGQCVYYRLATDEVDASLRTFLANLRDYRRQPRRSARPGPPAASVAVGRQTSWLGRG